MGPTRNRLRLARGIAATVAVVLLVACEGDGLSAGNSGSSSSPAAVKPPASNLQPSSTTVEAGQSVTLKWNASNAQACSASGGWSGSQPTSGTLSTTPLASTTSYTLNCTGSGGSASQSAEVQVTQPAPTITLSASPTTINAGENSTLTWATKN